MAWLPLAWVIGIREGMSPVQDLEKQQPNERALEFLERWRSEEEAVICCSFVGDEIWG